MENWAKPRTTHTHVHGPLHGPVNGLYVDTGKKWPTAVVDGSGRAPWKSGQNHVQRTRHVHGPLHGPVNGLYVDTGKKGPTPVVDGT